MATLTNTKIKDTYPGLIKLDDNGAVQPITLKQLTDGTGGSLPIQVSQVETKFIGAVDLTGVTVTGLDAAGLVPGTGTDSMQSVAALTTNPATAIGDKSIALGDTARGGSFAGASHAIAIGTDADAESAQSVAIGYNTWAQSGYCIAIGSNAHARISDCISIGRDSQAANVSGIAIGYNTQTTIDGIEQIAIGGSARGIGNYSISIGRNSETVGVQSVAIGYGAEATAQDAVALGTNVVAATTSTTSVTELETQAVGGGIIMYSPNGTGYKLTVSDAGAPVFTAI